MVGKISLLDCTLRDGGYVNDWKFGNGTLTCIFDRLNEAGIDIIEVGFIDERHPVDPDRTIQPDSKSLTETFSNTSERKSLTVAMIEYGTCNIDKLQPRSETMLDGIRLIFKKKELMREAIEFGKEIMKKGYVLFLQMVSITTYEDKDVLEFAKAVNDIGPFAVSIVDTHGLLHKEQLFHYFELLDEHLDSSISIGYHSHNNFQLAYANTIEMLKFDTDRDIVVDGTLYGMGLRAGNAPLELISMHLNDNYGKNYDIDQILEAINVNILPIYEKRYWGYDFLYYVSSMNDCRPDYIKYLLEKKTLSIKAVNDVLRNIAPEFRLFYNKQHIEELYMEYLLDNVNDSEDVSILTEKLQGKDLLLLGPGKSISQEFEKIKKAVEATKTTVIAVNFVPKMKTDYIFISNPKRYSLMVPHMDRNQTKVIATSNVTPIKEPFDYTIGYNKLVSESDEIWDNALVILLNLLKRIGSNTIYLAGFDGFRENIEMNYIDNSFDLSKNLDYLSAVNTLLTKKLKEYRSEMNIVFLTKSLYEGDDVKI